MSETTNPDGTSVFRNSAVTATVGDDFVATVELCTPPNNFFSLDQIGGVADALEILDDDDRCRAAVLRAQGKHFCAGADFSGAADSGTGSSGAAGAETAGSVTARSDDARAGSDGASAVASTGRRAYTTDELYGAAVRIFRTQTPVVAAVQGAAIGGGLGLALSADFRIAAPEARFSANFARLGFHHGFGLSVTLPRLVGEQAAAELLFTGRRVKGDEAVEIGLADRLATLVDLATTAHAFAREIAISAPLAIRSIRATLRGDLADRVAAATAHEGAEQAWLRATADFAEGNAAMGARRAPDFRGH